MKREKGPLKLFRTFECKFLYFFTVWYYDSSAYLKQSDDKKVNIMVAIFLNLKTYVIMSFYDLWSF